MQTTETNQKNILTPEEDSKLLKCIQNRLNELASFGTNVESACEEVGILLSEDESLTPEETKEMIYNTLKSLPNKARQYIVEYL